jgi:hypothetical protein
MKLIKINTDYYIVVDNSLDFSETDYYWDDKQKEIRTGSNNHVTGGYKIKITHSTQPLECDRMWTPVNGKQWMCNTMLCCGKILNLKTKPISLQEVKELIGEIDVEKKAHNWSTRQTTRSTDYWRSMVSTYVEAYTQALEDNKERKYTEAQLIWAIQEAYGHGQNDEFDGVNKAEKSIIVITNYLQPKTEWEVDIINGKLTLI